MEQVLCGADRLQEYESCLRGGRVGLITAPTGRTASGVSTIQALARVCDLRVLFGPEHGVRGDCAAGALVQSYTDAASGLPVYSLYGKDSKRLSQTMMDQFDILVYDIQDIGSRYYTFLSTLLYALEDCAAAHKAVVVLDRPNPLGNTVEGNVLQPEMKSFVGCYPMPNRYGLTVGEFAQMVNAERSLGCNLTVVPCRGWRREMLFPQWGRPWVMPSLNIPAFETALLYTGTCLFEGSNLSEGRGTANPFALIGAPYIRDPEALAQAFNCYALLGLVATPYYFTPTASKHQGRLCGGVHLHCVDVHAARPLAAAMILMDEIRRRYPKDFALLPPHTLGGRPFISLLAGHRQFEQPRWDVLAWQAEQQEQAHAFAKHKTVYHLYQ